MNKTDTLRELLGTFSSFLDETIDGLSQEQASAAPAGTPASIAAQYAHVMNSLDMGIHGLLGAGTPLIMDD